MIYKNRSPVDIPRVGLSKKINELRIRFFSRTGRVLLANGFFHAFFLPYEFLQKILITSAYAYLVKDIWKK